MAKSLYEQAVETRDEVAKRLAKADEKITGTDKRAGLQGKANEAQKALDEAKVKRDAIAAEMLKAQRAVDALADLDDSAPSSQTVAVEGVASGEGVGPEQPEGTFVL